MIFSLFARYGPRQVRRLMVAVAIVLVIVASIGLGGHSATATSIRAVHHQGGPAGALVQIEKASGRFDVVVGGHTLDMLQTTISPDAVIQTAVGDFRGQDGLNAYLDAEAKAFPSATYELLNLTVDGDTTTIRWRMTYQDTVTSIGRATLTAENGTVVAINVVGPNQTTAAEPDDATAHGSAPSRGGVIRQ